MGKIVAGFSILALTLGIASAEEFSGIITKVDGNKLTVTKFKGGFGKGGKGFKKKEAPKDTTAAQEKKGDEKKGKGGKGGFKGGFKGEEVILTCVKDVKIMKRGKYDAETKKFAASEKLEGGLMNELFTKITKDKGQFARFTTNEDGKVTEITVGGRGGKGGKGKKKAPPTVEFVY